MTDSTTNGSAVTPGDDAEGVEVLQRWLKNMDEPAVNSSGQPIIDREVGVLPRDSLGRPVGPSVRDVQEHASLAIEGADQPLLVRQYTLMERARQEARRQVARESQRQLPDLDDCSATLETALTWDVTERVWAVEHLAQQDSLVSLPSPRKTGKTTFLANLAAAAVDGRPFLDRFETNLTGNVCVINYEMNDLDYVDAFRQLGIRNTSRIRILNCRSNGVQLDLMDQERADKLAAWLRRNDAEWLFLDPWKNVLSASGVGMNDNDGVNLLTARVQDVHAQANIKLTVIPMHTTQATAEAGFERGKGAGEMEDAMDALWRYTRAGGQRDAPRVLAVEGRGGAALDETEVLFDEVSGRLTLGEGNRHSARARGAEEAVLSAVQAAAMTGNPLNTGRLRSAVTGFSNEVIDAARDALEALGQVHSERQSGRGGGTLWLPGSAPNPA